MTLLVQDMRELAEKHIQEKLEYNFSKMYKLFDVIDEKILSAAQCGLFSVSIDLARDEYHTLGNIYRDHYEYVKNTSSISFAFLVCETIVKRYDGFKVLFNDIHLSRLKEYSYIAQFISEDRKVRAKCSINISWYKDQ